MADIPAAITIEELRRIVQKAAEGTATPEDLAKADAAPSAPPPGPKADATAETPMDPRFVAPDAPDPDPDDVQPDWASDED